MITSLNNEKIKSITNLKQSKFRKETGLFLVEGEHLVKEARLANVLVETYTITHNLEGELVSEQVMKKICNTDTVIKQIGICKLITKDLIASKILILDKVQDPGNLGTLMRSAKAFKFDTIFLSDGCVDIYNDKVIRSSQGAIFKLNFITGNIVEFINKIKNTHNVFGTDVTNGVDVKNINLKENVAVILGNEGYGISEEVKKLNLKNIYINMDNTESLNVSVAGSIIMYELNK